MVMANSYVKNFFINLEMLPTILMSEMTKSEFRKRKK